MQIINPLYDKAFKYLMENNLLAKKVIKTIIGEEIVDLTLNQQETSINDDKRGLTLYRLDFKATILQPDGTKKTVLIELQKSKYITDIQRFRIYLGSNYIKPEHTSVDGVIQQKTSYPIISIYILGYNIDEIPYLALAVKNQTIDLKNNQPVQVKSDFDDQLNHTSYILQIRRLPEKRQTRLENFLTLFNQAWCSENHYILDLQDVPEEFSDIARYLQTPVIDEKFRNQLQVEDEIDTIFDTQESEHIKKLDEAKAQLEEERKAKEKERKAKEQERKEKEQAQENAKQAQSRLSEIVKNLRKSGLSDQVIAQSTGLTPDEINRM